MFRIEDFRAEHIWLLEPQPEQVLEKEGISQEMARAIEMSGSGYTIFEDEKPIMCAVLIKVTNERGSLWALVSKDISKCTVRGYRLIKRLLESSRFRRVESIVMTRFKSGHKLNKMLGFKLETPDGMEHFGKNGETYSLYSRVK